MIHSAGNPSTKLRHLVIGRRYTQDRRAQEMFDNEILSCYLTTVGEQEQQWRSPEQHLKDGLDEIGLPPVRNAAPSVATPDVSSTCDCARSAN